MNIPRRQFVRLAASAAALPVAARLAWAQTYPTRPVRMIVPFAPGGPTDIVARLLTQRLGDHLGRQFYVENVAGAGGNLGMRAAARAAPDGYTLVLVSSSYMVNPSLYPKVPYDQAKDFVPVTLPAYAPNVLLASPSLPVKSVKELADFVQANPGKLSFASAGMGTTPYLSGELFKLSLEVRSRARAVQWFSAGDPVDPRRPHSVRLRRPRASRTAHQGRKPAGTRVLSAQHSSALPEVPTIAEAGFPGQEADTLLGVLAPAGTPKEIIDLLHREIVRIVALPDVKEQLDAIGFVPVANTPDEFAAVIKVESERWANVIRAANLKAEP